MQLRSSSLPCDVCGYRTLLFLNVCHVYLGLRSTISVRLFAARKAPEQAGRSGRVFVDTDCSITELASSLAGQELRLEG